MTATATTANRVGPLLREWRQRRRRTQLDLALDADVSTRHLSYVETGRAKPSAEMILTLSEVLEVPLRDRNVLLLAAGYAPAYGQRGLEEPEMEPVRQAIDRLLAAHEPSPAVVIDRHWGLVAANAAVGILTAGADPALLEPPCNVLRLALHPDGMAPRVRNLPEWRAHLLDALGREAVTTGDPALAALHAELAALPGGASHERDDAAAEIAVPLRITAPDGGTVLSMLSARTQFGSAVDVTLAELRIEAFFPADARTADFLRRARA